jgi:hypothetical protein
MQSEGVIVALPNLVHAELVEFVEAEVARLIAKGEESLETRG